MTRPYLYLVDTRPDLNECLRAMPPSEARATHERSRNLRSVSVLRMSVAIAATVATVYALLVAAMVLS
jgi:hypothetical protein